MQPEINVITYIIPKGTNRKALIFILSFNFDENNLNLIENIKITANENCKATIIIKYKSDHNVNAFHNGIIKTIAKNMADINIIIVNLMNDSSNNFLSIENTLEDSSKVKYTIVDFGGKHSITNFYSNLIGNFSNNINPITPQNMEYNKLTLH